MATGAAVGQSGPKWATVALRRGLADTRRCSISPSGFKSLSISSMTSPGPVVCALLALAACSLPAHDPGGTTAQDPAPAGPAGLRAYKEAYYRSLGQRFVGHVTERELMAQLRTVRVLYLGDHHDDDELHARMLALLDSVQRAGRPIVLGVEAIGEQDQRAVNDYLAGRIGMEELRRRIASRWPGSWLDSSQVEARFYRALLERAREHAIPVFALEPAPRWDLLRRDALMAVNVHATAERHPDALIVVVVGQAHLLGGDRVIQQVGLPWVALGARPSVALREQFASYPAPAGARYLITESGVLLRRPADR